MYVYFMLSIMNRLGLTRSYVTCTFASALVSKDQISIWHICLILKLALYKYHIIIIIIILWKGLIKVRAWPVGLIGLLSPLLWAGLWSWGTYQPSGKGKSGPIQMPSERVKEAVLCTACIENGGPRASCKCYVEVWFTLGILAPNKLTAFYEMFTSID